LVRNEIRKAGWRFIDTDDEFSIVPAAAPEKNKRTRKVVSVF
jgi:hypothetical protein